MAQKKKRRPKKPTIEYTYLAVRVEHYEASVSAAINHDAYKPQYAFRLEDDDPLYQFETRLRIQGMATDPAERAGEGYELTVQAEASPSRSVYWTLKDVHVRGEYNSPQYREYRGQRLPVYDPPKGLGVIEKVRGEPRWTGWIFAQPRFVTDLLVLLGQGRPLYLALDERKIERRRWVRSVALQTRDPAEE